MKPVVVYGASGHAKVVLDILSRCGLPVEALFDDDPAQWDTQIAGKTVVGGWEALVRCDPDRVSLFLAVGDNAARLAMAGRVRHLGYGFVRAVHPSAQIGSGAQLGQGVAVMAQVAVNVDAQIGDHAILNTACSVDHDCRVGDFVHLSPGVRLAGGVSIGDGAHLGTGATVLPGVTIGAGAVVGAGACVIAPLPARVTAVGVPARVIKPHPTLEKRNAG